MLKPKWDCGTMLEVKLGKIGPTRAESRIVQEQHVKFIRMIASKTETK